MAAKGGPTEAHGLLIAFRDAVARCRYGADHVVVGEGSVFQLFQTAAQLLQMGVTAAVRSDAKLCYICGEPADVRDETTFISWICLRCIKRRKRRALMLKALIVGAIALSILFGL